jgi:hypothetical protein
MVARHLAKWAEMAPPCTFPLTDPFHLGPNRIYLVNPATQAKLLLLLASLLVPPRPGPKSSRCLFPLPTSRSRRDRYTTRHSPFQTQAASRRQASAHGTRRSRAASEVEGGEKISGPDGGGRRQLHGTLLLGDPPPPPPHFSICLIRLVVDFDRGLFRECRIRLRPPRWTTAAASKAETRRRWGPWSPWQSPPTTAVPWVGPCRSSAFSQ